MGYKDIETQLRNLLPAYVRDWTGEGWLLRKDVLDCKEKNTLMVGVHETGVFVYEYKKGGYATMQDMDEFDHTTGLFDELIEPVWLIDENGEYDLDFLMSTNYVHADTFDELLADYKTFINWLESDK